MSIARLLTFVAALSLTGAASADVIVDTGPGPVSASGGYSLDEGQWLAAGFTLTSGETITDVDGWIGGGLTGTLHVAILSDSFASLYSAQITAGNSSFTSGWAGADGVSWILNPGTYYAAFERLSNDTFSGFMDDSPKANPDVLPYAASSTQGSTWNNFDDLDLGLRILGENQATVPEPSTIALIGLALGGLALGKRKKA